MLFHESCSCSPTKRAWVARCNGRDSARASVWAPSAADGQFVLAGNILVRQRGTHDSSRTATSASADDDTLFALTDRRRSSFERKGRDKKQVSVYPQTEAAQ